MLYFAKLTKKMKELAENGCFFRVNYIDNEIMEISSDHGVVLEIENFWRVRQFYADYLVKINSEYYMSKRTRKIYKKYHKGEEGFKLIKMYNHKCIWVIPQFNLDNKYHDKWYNVNKQVDLLGKEEAI